MGTSKANTCENFTEEQIRALLSGMETSAIVAMTDAKWNITYANDRFCEISGYSRDELLGQNHRLVSSGRHPKSYWKRMYETILAGKFWQGYICNRKKDGTLYWLDSVIGPVTDESGKLVGSFSIRYDTTTLHRTLSDMSEVRKRLSLAMEGGVEGLYHYMPDQDVFWFSDRFHELLGQRPNTLGDDLKIISGMHRSAGEDSLDEDDLNKAFRTGDQSVEVRLRIADGSCKWFRLTTKWLHCETSQSFSVAGSISDIDLTKDRERQLQEARREAELANSNKSLFLANMSHEIRTPMTAILGFADVLEDDGLNEQSRELTRDAIQAIRTNARHLLTVINDILDLSKIEAGRMTVESIETEPIQIIEEVVSLTRPSAQGKGLAIGIEYETPIPVRIKSDPTRFRQILLNLIGNAIKFTEIGGITVRVACDGHERTLRVGVEDTGIGMSDEQIENVRRFELFTQADGSTTRKYGGSGMGLRISNTFACMLGGGVDVTSERGVGSVFTVSVETGDLEGVAWHDPSETTIAAERATAHDERAPDVPETEETAPLSGVRILLVEDGPDNRRLISHHLEKAGASVTQAENGRVACDLFEQSEDFQFPDLVLMDMQMPELDGYQATRILRERGVSLPVIAITAHAMSGDRDRCFDAGCDEYLVKPVNRATLLERCASWAQQSRNRAAT